MSLQWSDYQLAIYDAVANSNDSLLIEAVAGSGKTTVLVEAINHVPADQSVCFVCFNKSIAEELGRRVTRRGAVCATLHSVGWNAWRRSLGWDSNLCKVEHNKTWGVMKEVLSWPEREKWGATTARMVGLGKQVGMVPRAMYCETRYAEVLEPIMEGALVLDTDEAWEALADHYSVEWEEVNLELVRRVLARSIELGREQVDFDDMLYLPVVGGVEFDKWDVVFVDEAQDLSGIQIEMVSRMVKP